MGATPEEIARRLGGGAAPWSLDRRVVVAESNQRREAEPLMIIGHATSKLCVVELRDEPGRWYCGADDGDHVLTWTWFETVEQAWEWLD